MRQKPAQSGKWWTLLEGAKLEIDRALLGIEENRQQRRKNDSKINAANDADFDSNANGFALAA